MKSSWKLALVVIWNPDLRYHQRAFGIICFTSKIFGFRRRDARQFKRRYSLRGCITRDRYHSPAKPVKRRSTRFLDARVDPMPDRAVLVCVTGH
jgi:hypothetical protein